MALKYSLRIKDIKWDDFKTYFDTYFFGLFKSILPKKKIKNLDDLKSYVQKQSAWVSQVTLYGYLKTRMGTRYVLMFNDEKFLASIKLAKWNIYSIALQDLTLFTLSYLKVFYNSQETTKAKEIYEEILNNEIINGMPEDIVSKGKNLFEERLTKIDWNKYYESWPFNESALALYEWAPIAENLKTLDRKIVLNSMILKWENVQKEFYQLVKKI